MGRAKDTKLFFLDQAMSKCFNISCLSKGPSGTLWVGRMVAGERKLKLESLESWAAQERYLPACCKAAKNLSVLLMHFMGPAVSSVFVSLVQSHREEWKCTVPAAATCP